MTAQPSKVQCMNSKIFPPPHLVIRSVDQNVFFPEHVLPIPFLIQNSQCETDVENVYSFDVSRNQGKPFDISGLFH